MTTIARTIGRGGRDVQAGGGGARVIPASERRCLILARALYKRLDLLIEDIMRSERRHV